MVAGPLRVGSSTQIVNYGMENHPPPPPPVPPSGGPPRLGGGGGAAAQLPPRGHGGVMGTPPGVFVTDGVHGQSVAFSPYHGNLFAVAGSQNYGIAGGCCSIAMCLRAAQQWNSICWSV